MKAPPYYIIVHYPFSLQFCYIRRWTTFRSKVAIVKQSHYRPGQALRIPEGWGSQISRQSAHKGVKVFSPTHRPPLPPGNKVAIVDIHKKNTTEEPHGTGPLINISKTTHHYIKLTLRLLMSYIYRVIHKSLRNFRTQLHNNQDRHRRMEHFNRCRTSPRFFFFCEVPLRISKFHR